jgi:hypothetical protein
MAARLHWLVVRLAQRQREFWSLCSPSFESNARGVNNDEYNISKNILFVLLYFAHINQHTTPFHSMHQQSNLTMPASLASLFPSPN